MAQPTQWVPASLDYMKKVKSCMAQLIWKTEPSEIYYQIFFLSE